MFVLRFERLSVSRPGNSGIVFELSLQNRASRIATVISQAYELWFVRDSGAHAEYLATLSRDLSNANSEQPVYQPQVICPLNLVWHYTPLELQRVEALRKGSQPSFQVRNRLGVSYQWLNADRSAHAGPGFSEEAAFDAQTSTHPIPISVDRDAWARLLNEIGFQQIILQELPIIPFPPGFGRAEKHLRDAWDHYRAGRNDGALQSCFKAFECLGYNLAGEKIEREKLLARLMDGQEPSKRAVIERLWDALNQFFHLARHERGEPVQINHGDAELAVICATSLLGFFSGTRL
jgi:hypothetical protein